MKRLGLLLICAMGLCTAFASGASAASPCGADWAFTQPAKSDWQQVAVPSLQFPQTYHGVVVRPNPTPPGTQPAVVVMHGRGGTQCSVWWAARLLAAHGYVAMTINNPGPTTLTQHIDAVQSALHFLQSPSNPYASSTDPSDIGLVGHSLGAAAISFIQALNAPFIKAIVGLDNIRGWANGDAGAFVDCQQPPSGLVAAHAPALGEASEVPCVTEGQLHPAASKRDFTEKRLAFTHWRNQGMASMEAVMKNFKHSTFAGLPDPTNPAATAKHAQQLRHAGYYMQAWLDLWLRHDPTATPRLCDPAIASLVLSSKPPNPSFDPPDAYQSSLYLPSMGINRNNLLSGTC
jgi:hypothetical protein